MIQAVCTAQYGTCPIDGVVNGELQMVAASQLKSVGALIKRGQKVEVSRRGSYKVTNDLGHERNMYLLCVNGFLYNASAFQKA